MADLRAEIVAVLTRDGELSGLEVYRALAATRGRWGRFWLCSGRVYAALASLEDMDMVTSRWEPGPPPPDRGGYRHRLYTLAGVR